MYGHTFGAKHYFDAIQYETVVWPYCWMFPRWKCSAPERGDAFGLEFRKIIITPGPGHVVGMNETCFKLTPDVRASTTIARIVVRPMSRRDAITNACIVAHS